MLFHVTMQHDAAHCPGLHQELMGPALAAFGSLEATAAAMGVTIIGSWSALPDHTDFMIAEAADNATLAFFLSAGNPYGEIETETRAVTALDDLRAQAMAGGSDG